MKNTNFIFASGVLLLLISCNNSNDLQVANSYTISGKISGLHSGSVKLVSFNQDNEIYTTVDSVGFLNDSFSLKGALASSQRLTLVIEPGNWRLPFFAENSVIKITGDTTASEHYDYTSHGGSKGVNIKTFSIAGSKSNDDYMRYQNDKGLKQFDTVFATLNKKYNAVAGKDLDAEYKVRDQMDSVSKILQDSQIAYIKNYAGKNPSSPVGAYLLSQVYLYMNDKPLAKIDSVLNIFNGDAKNSAYYKSVSASQDKIKALLPGRMAPDFTLLKRDSTKFNLSSMRGSYTMIDFWASWCHPCRQAIPHWKEMYNKYHNKGFDIVSVSDDYRWPDWLKAMDQEKMPWQQVCDEFPVKNKPARIGTMYMTRYIPFYVLLDKDGKILVYSGSEDDIDNKLKEIFGS